MDGDFVPVFPRYVRTPDAAVHRTKRPRTLHSASDHGMKDETLQPDTPAKHMPPSVVGEADIEKPRLWSATNEESSEDGADDEEDGSRSPPSGHDLPGPAWQGYVFFAVPVLICLFGSGPPNRSTMVGRPPARSWVRAMFDELRHLQADKLPF